MGVRPAGVRVAQCDREKVEGDTLLPWGSQGQALLGASRESLAADFVDAVAALHRFDWRSTPFGEFDQRHAAEAVFVDGEDAQGFTILPGERKKEISSCLHQLSLAAVHGIDGQLSRADMGTCLASSTSIQRNERLQLE